MARRDNLTLRQLALRFAGTRGHWTVAGTPTQVADAIEARFRAGGADGFNVMPYLFPDALTDFANEVVPELRRRGRLPQEGERSGTLRERLFGDGHNRLPERHPATRYRGGANLHEEAVAAAR